MLESKLAAIFHVYITAASMALSNFTAMFYSTTWALYTIPFGCPRMT